MERSDQELKITVKSDTGEAIPVSALTYELKRGDEVHPVTPVGDVIPVPSDLFSEECGTVYIRSCLSEPNENFPDGIKHTYSEWTKTPLKL